MLEIKPLSYFIAAYEEKSISAAAIRCFISQPSISHAIKTLELKLDQPLFTRSKLGITPTAHGKKLYQDAKQLIKHANDIELSFHDAPNIPINIFFQGDIGLQDLSSVIQQITHSGTSVQLNRVSELSQSDIAFVDQEQVGKRFGSIPLFKEGFSALMPSDHPLSKTLTLGLSDLQNEYIIARPYCSRGHDFSQLLKQHKIELNIEAQADNDLQVIELVSLGFGLAILPSRRLNQLPDGVIEKPIRLEFNREVVLAYRSSRKDIKQLLDTVNWQWALHNITSIKKPAKAGF